MVKTYWKRGRKKMQKFLKEVKKLRGNPYIKMGYPKEWSEIREKKGGVTVLDVAIFHEYGTKNLPERSFIRSTRYAKYRAWRRLSLSQFNKIISGQAKVDDSLHKIGLTQVNDVKSFIRRRKVLPPSDRAIEQGGVTLWDTGQLINSLAYSIKSGGTTKKGNK